MSSYTGRLTDLLIFQVAAEPGVAETVGLSIGQTPRVTAGPQKAAQSFILALMTRQGSAIHDPEYGTTLLDELASGALRDEDAIRGAIASASREAMSYLRNEAINPPDDELIVAVDMESLDFTGSSVSVRIKLTTAAGDTREYLVPLTALPR